MDKQTVSFDFLCLGDGASIRATVLPALMKAYPQLRGVHALNAVTEEQRRYSVLNGMYIHRQSGAGRLGAGAEEGIVSSVSQVLSLRDLAAVKAVATTEELGHIWVDEDASAFQDGLSAAEVLLYALFARFQKKKRGVMVFWASPSADAPADGRRVIEAMARALSMPEGFLRFLAQDCVWTAYVHHRHAVVVPYDSQEASGQTAVYCEGAYRLWFAADILPEALSNLAADANVLVGRQYAQAVADEQAVLQWCLLLAAALGLAENKHTVREVLLSESLRPLLAAAMTADGLGGADRRRHLEAVARAFERLSNAYFACDPADCLSDGAALWRQAVLPRVGALDFCCHRLQTWLFAMLIMHAIDQKLPQYQTLHALSCDMECEMLSYAVLSDRALWQADLRDMETLEAALPAVLGDIQRLGYSGALKRLFP